MEKQDKTESWLNRKWRPMMAVMYFVVCITDFIIFPILWSILQANYGGTVTQAWLPITVHGGGLFHLAMGAVLGIAAWSRGQEKMLHQSNYKYRDESYYNDTPRKTFRSSRVPIEGDDEVL